MEIAQLVVSPAILLGAFIFFWRESKAERLELGTRMVQRMDRMEDKMEKRFAETDTRLVALEDKMDRRFIALEDKMEKRFTAVDERFIAVDARIGRLEGVLIAQQKAS